MSLRHETAGASSDQASNSIAELNESKKAIASDLEAVRAELYAAQLELDLVREVAEISEIDYVIDTAFGKHCLNLFQGVLNLIQNHQADLHRLFGSNFVEFLDATMHTYHSNLITDLIGFLRDKGNLAEKISAVQTIEQLFEIETDLLELSETTEDLELRNQVVELNIRLNKLKCALVSSNYLTSLFETLNNISSNRELSPLLQSSTSELLQMKVMPLTSISEDWNKSGLFLSRQVLGPINALYVKSADEIAEINKELEKKIKGLEAAEAELQQRQVELKEVEAKLSAADELVSQKEMQLALKQKELEVKASSVIQLSDQLESMQSLLSDLEGQVVSAQSTIQSLQSHIAQLKKTKDALEADNRNLELEVTRIEGELDDEKQKVFDLTMQLERSASRFHSRMEQSAFFRGQDRGFEKLKKIVSPRRYKIITEVMGAIDDRGHPKFSHDHCSEIAFLLMYRTESPEEIFLSVENLRLEGDQLDVLRRIIAEYAGSPDSLPSVGTLSDAKQIQKICNFYQAKGVQVTPQQVLESSELNKALVREVWAYELFEGAKYRDKSAFPHNAERAEKIIGHFVAQYLVDRTAPALSRA